MRHDLQLAGTTLLWLVGLHIVWDCLASHCIIGSHHPREFPSFFKPQWQSLCTALTAGIRLSLGLCKRAVKKFIYVADFHRPDASDPDNLSNGWIRHIKTAPDDMFELAGTSTFLALIGHTGHSIQDVRIHPSILILLIPLMSSVSNKLSRKQKTQKTRGVLCIGEPESIPMTYTWASCYYHSILYLLLQPLFSISYSFTLYSSRAYLCTMVISMIAKSIGT